MALLLQMAATAVFAQVVVSGELGANLLSHGFDNSLAQQGLDFGVNRRISNHYLSLLVAGSVVNENFAIYSASSRINGTLYSVEADGKSFNEYSNLGLDGYAGTLKLFPLRRYPLYFFLGRSKIQSLRYESGNRAEAELVSPELAIVRSYESDVEQRGVEWRLTLDRGFDFSAGAERRETEINRRYDFAENRNIWMLSTTLRPDPISEFLPVEVVNSITDDTVLLFVDLAFVDSLAAGESINLSVERGVHDIELIPLRLNAHRTTVDVDGEMKWEILFSPPAGSTDLQMTMDMISSKLSYDAGGALKNETTFGRTMSLESIQGIDNELTLLNNSVAYAFSRRINLSMQTTISQVGTEIINVDSQESSSFINQTVVKFEKLKAIDGSVSHMIGKMSTKAGVTDIQSTNQQFMARGSRATGVRTHRLDLKLGANLLSDSSDYVNNQYTAEMGNRLPFILFGAGWEPLHKLKYSLGKQSESDTDIGEWESRFLVLGEHPDVGMLGKIGVKGEHTWRRRGDGKVSDTRVLYRGELNLDRAFNENYKLKFSSTMERESQKSATIFGAGPGGALPVRPAETRALYKAALEMSPLEKMDLSASMTLVTQEGVEIRKLSASFSAQIPGIKLPIRSSILREERLLENLPRQSQLEWRTKLSYNFRLIRLLFQYRYIRESLLVEDYSFSELNLEISRSFQLFQGRE